jgi:hypothetical protein
MGTLIDSSELVVNSQTVERQNITIADPSSASGLVNVTPKGVQGSFALTTQDFKDSGRKSIIIAYSGTSGITATNTLLTFQYMSGGTVSTSKTEYTVTTGKTFRIQSILVSLRNSTAAAHDTFCNILVDYTGTIITTSSPTALPITVELSASAVSTINIPIPDGLEFPTGSTIGMSAFADTSATIVLTNIILIGYEY